MMALFVVHRFFHNENGCEILMNVTDVVEGNRRPYLREGRSFGT